MFSFLKGKAIEKSQPAIALAVSYIEEGYKIAKEKRDFEPSILTMYENVNENSDSNGFEVILYTNSTKASLEYIEYVISNNYIGWQVRLDGDDIYFEKSQLTGVKCYWNDFNKAVWDQIKEKHPSWEMEFIRANKSCIRADRIPETEKTTSMSTDSGKSEETKNSYIKKECINKYKEVELYNVESDKGCNLKMLVIPPDEDFCYFKELYTYKFFHDSGDSEFIDFYKENNKCFFVFNSKNNEAMYFLEKINKIVFMNMLQSDKNIISKAQALLNKIEAEKEAKKQNQDDSTW